MQKKIDTNIQSKDRLYICMVDIAFELIELAKNKKNIRHVQRLCSINRSLAAAYNFDDLSEVFFDIGEGVDFHVGPWSEYLERVKNRLELFSREAGVNPGGTSVDEDLLNRYTFSIHEKMVKNPNKSPEYFIEMVLALDKLIKEKDLNIFAAAKELSFALDRPQILASDKLKIALEKARNLELPAKITKGDAHAKWKDFYNEIKKVKENNIYDKK